MEKKSAPRKKPMHGREKTVWPMVLAVVASVCGAGGKHEKSSRCGRFCSGCRALLVGVKSFQLLAKRVTRLGGDAPRKLADRGLFTAASGCDFDLRHAVGNQLCNEVFPVHAPMITVVRYSCKRFFVSGLQ